MTPTATRPVRVLIVDDSAVVRAALRRELERDPGVEVLAAVADPFAAREAILADAPDVITLDLDMPRMDGLTFLHKLMAQRPIPTVVISSLTPAGSRVAVAALAAGATDVLAKPAGAYSAANLAADLVARVKAAAHARPQARPASTHDRPPVGVAPPAGRFSPDAVWALGASTGGVAALHQVLERFPPNAPATLIVQHLPAAFTAGFAERLDDAGPSRVRVAEAGDVPEPGVVLIAPGGRHLTLVPRSDRPDSRFVVRLDDVPPLHGVRPSVDRLFDSLARVAGPSTVAALLTGMGRDGAAGLLALRRAGGRTIAQDETTSVVYGMPHAAVELGAAEAVVPLHAIADAMAARTARVVKIAC